MLAQMEALAPELLDLRRVPPCWSNRR